METLIVLNTGCLRNLQSNKIDHSGFLVYIKQPEYLLLQIMITPSAHKAILMMGVCKGVRV